MLDYAKITIIFQNETFLLFFPPPIPHSGNHPRQLVHHEAHLAVDGKVAAVFVVPGRNLHESVLGTGIEALATGLVAVAEAIVTHLNNGQLLHKQQAPYLTLLRTDKRRHDDGTFTGGTQHSVTLALEERSVRTMADKRQIALRRQQGAAADIRKERLGRRSRGRG